MFAGWKICTDYSPGQERNKVIPENFVKREVFLEVENSSFSHNNLKRI